MAEEKKTKWTKVEDISEEDVAQMLNDREGGRKAGRGDSPYSQEFYDKTYGLDKKKEESKKGKRK